MDATTNWMEKRRFLMAKKLISELLSSQPLRISIERRFESVRSARILQIVFYRSVLWLISAHYTPL